MMRRMWAVMVVVAVGCVAQSDSDVQQSATPMMVGEANWYVVSYSGGVVSYQQAQFELDPAKAPAHGVYSSSYSMIHTYVTDYIDDPCLCRAEGCLDDWVDSHFGCDVCIVFSCDDTMPHACRSCP